MPATTSVGAAGRRCCQLSVHVSYDTEMRAPLPLTIGRNDDLDIPVLGGEGDIEEGSHLSMTLMPRPSRQRRSVDGLCLWGIRGGRHECGRGRGSRRWCGVVWRGVARRVGETRWCDGYLIDLRRLPFYGESSVEGMRERTALPSLVVVVVVVSPALRFVHLKVVDPNNCALLRRP